MQLLSANPTITTASIPLLLEWWQQRKRLATANGVNSLPVFKNTDDSYLDAYRRLMEVYSVVKSGGVQVQTEAAKAHLSRELAALHQAADAAASERQAQIQQEILELERSTAWRLSTLNTIRPAEEAAVRQYLSEIEQVLLLH
ncbi:MAG: hypothetical protein F6J97_15725 [Leptolyngbya sp. SIO4C1]|nr:hypothetical protein [Leptolyngbya sp. SIO4C1]